MWPFLSPPGFILSCTKISILSALLLDIEKLVKAGSAVVISSYILSAIAVKETPQTTAPASVSHSVLGFP